MELYLAAAVVAAAGVAVAAAAAVEAEAVAVAAKLQGRYMTRFSSRTRKTTSTCYQLC